MPETPLKPSTRYLPFLVLAAGLLVTGMEAAREQNFVGKFAKSQFDQAVFITERRVDQRMIRYISALEGARTLYAVSPSVGRDEFRIYVQSLKLAQRYPGLASIHYTPRMTGAAEHLASERIEPYNPAAPGFNLPATVADQQALDRARDEDMPTLSHILSRPALLSGGQPEISLFVPVYSKGAPPGTVEQRRASLQGYVSGVFRPRDLLRDIYYDQIKTHVDFEVFDGAGVSRETLLYDGDGIAQALDSTYQPSYATTRTLTVAGRTWTLYFSTLPEFDRRPGHHYPLFILVGGAALSLLLFWITRNQVNARLKDQQITSELRESRANLARAQQIGRMGSWEVNLADYSWRWSDELYDLCGLARGATPPDYQALLSVIHPADLALVKQHLDAALNAQQAFGMDHRLGANDRRERFVYHHAEVINDTAGKPVRIVGTLQDITERKRAESRV